MWQREAGRAHQSIRLCENQQMVRRWDFLRFPFHLLTSGINSLGARLALAKMNQVTAMNVIKGAMQAVAQA